LQNVAICSDQPHPRGPARIIVVACGGWRRVRQPLLYCSRVGPTPSIHLEKIFHSSGIMALSRAAASAWVTTGEGHWGQAFIYDIGSFLERQLLTVRGLSWRIHAVVDASSKSSPKRHNNAVYP